MDKSEGAGVYSLPQLQNLIKRSPGAYGHEFQGQWNAFEMELEMFEKSPQLANKHLHEVTMFMAQVSHYFKKNAEFMSTLLRIIESYMDVGRRLHLKTFLSALSILDNHGFADRNVLYAKYIALLSQKTDYVPNLIVSALVSSLKRIKDHAIMRKWQSAMFTAYESGGAVAQKRIQYILISLYVVGAWNDDTTANFICNGVFSNLPKIVEYSARFALGDLKRLHISMNENAGEKELDEEEQKRKAAELITTITRELSGKSHKEARNLKKLERLKKSAEKELSNIDDKQNTIESVQYSVLDQLYDQHTFCERVIKKTKTGKLTFKIRLLLLTVVSRVMKRNLIYIPGFFSELHKFMNPKQHSITRLLAVVAEAAHPQIPEDELRVTARHIINAFVIDSNAPEIIAVGLNTIREICKGNIGTLDADMIDDLIRFGDDCHDAAVKNCARSIRNLYRTEAPHILANKFKSKESVARESYTPSSDTGIPGLKILVDLKQYYIAKTTGAKTNFSEADVLKNKLLTDSDFAALKAIHLKQKVTQSNGISLREWLDQDEENWKELAENIFGTMDEELCGSEQDEPNLSDSPIEQVDPDSSIALAEENSETDEYTDLEEDHLDGLLSDADVEEAMAESELETDIDNGDASSDEAGKIASLHSAMWDDVVVDDSGNVDSDTEHAASFITDSTISARKKISLSQSREHIRQARKEMRAERAGKRHGGLETNRAGITNRSMARNKPAAMIRQKRDNREKVRRSCSDKVKSLRAHVKTLKLNNRQKFRRR